MSKDKYPSIFSKYFESTGVTPKQVDTSKSPVVVCLRGFINIFSRS